MGWGGEGGQGRNRIGHFVPGAGRPSCEQRPHEGQVEPQLQGKTTKENQKATREERKEYTTRDV